MDISEVIKELNSRIKAKFPDFRGSYLFGSYARGDYHKDSDVDLVLLFDKIDDDKISYVYNIMGELDYENDIVTIGLLYTKEKLEKNYIFHNEVVNKGIYYNAA
jgi:uncharacterized protein